jgi:hypothetical protein
MAGRDSQNPWVSPAFFVAASPSPEEAAANSMKQKWKRPADAASSGGPRGTDRLGSRINPTNSPSANKPQASYPADTAGEDDWTFFQRRRGVAVRTRFALPNEFPIDFEQHCSEYCSGNVVVRIAVTRDDRGEPVWGARSVMFCQGGHA